MNPRNELRAQWRVGQDEVQLSAGQPVRAERRAVPVDVEPHDHAFHEIGLVVEGSATHVMGSGRLPLVPGDIFVVPPEEVHALENVRGLEVINTYYLSEWLMSDLGLLWTEAGAVPLFLSRALMKTRIADTVQLRLAPADYEHVAAELAQIEAEGKARAPSPLYLRCCLEKAIALIARNWMKQDPTSATLVIRGEVWSAMEAVERAVNSGAPYSVARSAEASGLSVDHFSSLFRSSTGYGPTDYYQRRRVHRACQLLLNPAPSVTEVAAELGYSDAPHFCRVFKRYRGMTPSAYRELYNV
ncbi:MAG TPA: AraC family transcriptional regulator [Devosia sp.]|jgi:AraC-like DNA-binding protein/mannose-6-phosphate isomerase-like protein (cupin superfamily)|nr:AraC family transcriptional regulator [Devosia sp.]